MKDVKEKARELVDRYAQLEGYGDREETESILEEAMNALKELLSIK